MKHERMFSGIIYKAKRGCIYDDEKPRYNCYLPVDYANDCVTGDCWVCDKNGNIHPGYNVCPVPINADMLGQVVGRIPCE